MPEQAHTIERAAYLRRRKRQKRWVLLAQLGLLIGFFALWEIAARQGWIDDFIMHYEKRERTFERGQTIHNFNDSDYMVLEALSPRNLVVMDMKRGSIAIALGTTEYERCPKGEKPTKDNLKIGVLWEYGIYLDSMPSQINFKAYKAKYGIPERMENLYDYRAMLKRKYYFIEALSKDDDIPAKIQNEILSHIYAEYKTLEEDTFLDHLDDGKYDAGFEKEK